jgi:hypothetical protein
MSDGMYKTEFYTNDELKWYLMAHIIISHEMMVEWIEKGQLPAFVGTA